MERLKSFFLNLLFPHPIIIGILLPISCAMLVYAFAVKSANLIAVYTSYFLSAYTLTTVCVRIPQMIKFVKNFKTRNKYIKRYTEDIRYRIKLSLYATMAVNSLYALLQLGSGIHQHSVWFYALAVYYALLAVMRYFLLKETIKGNLKKDLFMEFLHYRLCGVFLLLINIALAVIVFYIVQQNRGFEHHYILTIAMAAYTFTAVIKSIVDVVKYRHLKSPVISSAKVISLTSALVSILSLETAMLTAFGGRDLPEFRQIITASTGAAVCIIVMTMAIYMIVSSTKEINKLKKHRQSNR
ncbi:MAG: hypothetical protein IJ264_02430 [Clostridia bacterium]|nr:hypothetical protein [Clostridia bacterium]